jgi:Zn-dependent protease with chaperone function
MPARLKSYFPSVPALALYLATLVSELPVVFMRMLLTAGVAAIVLLIKEGSAGGAMGYAELALIPTGWAIFALITPVGGGWWWRSNLGGREPSGRERSAYEAAMQELREQTDEPLQEPGGWFVLDTPELDASVCGNTLALSRGLFETTYLPAVLAHELGHLNTSDGRLTAAFNRLLINPPPRPKHNEQQQQQQRPLQFRADDRVLLTITLVGILIWLARKSVIFAMGGFGLRLIAPFWGSYWREREYLADSFAAALGQGEELADFLETHVLMHDHPVPLIWLTEHTHPPTELRLDRLRRAGAGGGPVAQAPEPVKPAPAGPPAAGPDGPALTEPGPCAVDLSGRQG